MNQLFKALSTLALLALSTTACSAQVVQLEPKTTGAPEAASYLAVLGKSLDDKDVADFMVANNCSSEAQFQVCR
ncbi:MAG TPA: hypothetical protein VFD54_18800, partial [Anaerolineales bacterium]|nr:hypothetical protein [Anaerolineales bacterium]